MPPVPRPGKEQPKVSILMLTYNRPTKIGRAIESVFRQTLQSWELLIVQDGSNAETGTIVSRYMAQDSRIRFFPRGIVGTIAEASNFGLAQATGDYIAILDDDDYWSFPEKLAQQVEFLETHPEYAACGGGYVLIDDTDRERGTFLKPETDERIRSRALLANPVANSTALFRRVLGGAPALYDERLRGYADWDFWLELGAAGKLYNFPVVLAHYALWQGGGSFRQHRVNARAGITIVWKHRASYGGFAAALLLAWAQFLYACLPQRVRQYSYATLSSLKKTLAASRGNEPPPPGAAAGAKKSAQSAG